MDNPHLQMPSFQHIEQTLLWEVWLNPDAFLFSPTHPLTKNMPDMELWGVISDSNELIFTILKKTTSSARLMLVGSSIFSFLI